MNVLDMSSSQVQQVALTLAELENLLPPKLHAPQPRRARPPCFLRSNLRKNPTPTKGRTSYPTPEASGLSKKTPTRCDQSGFSQFGHSQFDPTRKVYLSPQSLHSTDSFYNCFLYSELETDTLACFERLVFTDEAMASFLIPAPSFPESPLATNSPGPEEAVEDTLCVSTQSVLDDAGVILFDQQANPPCSPEDCPLPYPMCPAPGPLYFESTTTLNNQVMSCALQEYCLMPPVDRSLEELAHSDLEGLLTHRCFA